MCKQQESIFPHILAISASAGSGKTHTLTERYISFLFSPTFRSLSNILAITFTNKATGEMKERIIIELKKKALADSPEKEMAEKRLDELFDRYSDFRIQTIDSFLTAIGTASALELGFTPHFEITLNPKPIFSLVLDELLSKVNPDSKDEITQCFLRMLDELLWLKPETGWSIKKITLENINTLIKQTTLKGYKIRRVFSYEELKRHHGMVKGAVEEFIKKNKDVLDFQLNFSKAAESFLEGKKDPWESKMFGKDVVSEICKGKNKALIITPDHEIAWQNIRAGVSLLSEMTSHGYLCPFINVMTFFDRALESFKDRGQVIFMTDLNLRLKDFLYQQAEGAPLAIVPEIYLHLGDRISHFFIDEFQDTSRLQWENLFPLIEESLSKAGSLFYVGDKKQAIYRFRGGDSTLFDEARLAFLSVDNINEKFPEINYRSREQIVSFVNRIFSRDNLRKWIEGIEKEVDLSDIYDTYSHVHQNPNLVEKASGGFVSVQKIPSEGKLNKDEMNAEIEKQLVSLLKNQILPRFSLCNVTIIVRTNKEAAWITGILSAQNIPVASERTLDISSNHLICEIVRFLTFLDSPIDNFSFACFISGDIFCKKAGLKQGDVFAFLLKMRKSSKALYTLFREEWGEVWEMYIEPYFHAVGFLPIYDLVSKILKEYEIFKNFSEYKGFFYQLLEVLTHCETMGENNLKAFLAKWNNNEDRTDEDKKNFQAVLPEYADAIQIWTIHKAKGLQSPVVIIPFAYLNNESINMVYETDNDGNCIPYQINSETRSVSSRLEGLYQKEFSLQLTDELNAFYVAITRAEDEMYIFVPEYESMNKKLLAPIFFDENPVMEYGEQIAISNQQSAVSSQDKTLPCAGGRQRIYPQVLHEWQDKLVNKKKKMDTASEKRGRLVHEFLAGIQQLSLEWEKDLEAMFVSLPKEQQEIIPLMRRFFCNEDNRRWFVLTDGVEVYCEKEIVDTYGLIHRPDRMLFFPDRVVVLEFKSGEIYSEAHQQQVREYLSLVAEVYPDRKIEGWLIYVDINSQSCIVSFQD
ncbi:UvrD-helicase domain-containing protein [bacterium]|nr:UvrD-helicase domain-containing protein [bacterium]MBU1752540.1 UvrD-helicase domain-containing protein [bacterium]